MTNDTVRSNLTEIRKFIEIARTFVFSRVYSGEEALLHGHIRWILEQLNKLSFKMAEFFQKYRSNETDEEVSPKTMAGYIFFVAACLRVLVGLYT